MISTSPSSYSTPETTSTVETVSAAPTFTSSPESMATSALESANYDLNIIAYEPVIQDTVERSALLESAEIDQAFLGTEAVDEIRADAAPDIMTALLDDGSQHPENITRIVDLLSHMEDVDPIAAHHEVADVQLLIDEFGLPDAETNTPTDSLQIGNIVDAIQSLTPAEWADIGLDMTPGVGTVKEVLEAAAGETLIGGEEVATADRFLVLLSFIPGVKQLKTLSKLSQKILEKARELRDALPQPELVTPEGVRIPANGVDTPQVLEMTANGERGSTRRMEAFTNREKADRGLDSLSERMHSFTNRYSPENIRSLDLQNITPLDFYDLTGSFSRDVLEYARRLEQMARVDHINPDTNLRGGIRANARAIAKVVMSLQKEIKNTGRNDLRLSQDVIDRMSQARDLIGRVLQ